MVRRIVAVLAALVAVVVLASPASAETGTLMHWDPSYGDFGPQNNDTLLPGKNNTLYIIDSSDSRFPISTMASQWTIRTGSNPTINWRDFSGAWDCHHVHCAFITSDNEGDTGWRVRAVTRELNGSVTYGMGLAINTFYAWDNRGTVSQSGACQAIGKALGLDYTRTASDFTSCMSSAMRYTVPNNLDVGYVINNLWPPN